MLLFLNFSLACRVTTRPWCETETRPVDDDEMLGDLGVSVEDILKRVAGEQLIEVEDANDVEYDVDVETVRIAGAAKFADATLTEEETVSFGIGENTLQIHVTCEDSVTLAVQVSVADEAGLVSILADGALQATASTNNPYSSAIEAQLTAADAVPGWDGSTAVSLHADYDESALVQLVVGQSGVSESLLVGAGE